MYTVHFLYVPSPWGGSGYDPVPEKHIEINIEKPNTKKKTDEK